MLGPPLRKWPSIWVEILSLHGRSVSIVVLHLFFIQEQPSRQKDLVVRVPGTLLASCHQYDSANNIHDIRLIKLRNGQLNCSTRARDEDREVG